MADGGSIPKAAAERPDFAAFRKSAPAAAAALLELGRAVAAAGLEKALLELVKLRASQINGCAFCIAYHLDLARTLGVPAAKLDLVAAWRDAPVYGARERAALAWTERLTAAPAQGLSGAEYAAAAAVFVEGEMAALAAAIGLINAWNRIGVAFRFPPPAAGGAP